MTRKWIAILALAGLSACGDPMAGIERLSETDLPRNASSAAALPSPEELDQSTGVFGRLLNAPADPVTAPDPAPDSTLDAAPLTAPDPSASAQTADSSPADPAPAPRGLFGLFRQTATPVPSPPAATAPGSAARQADDAAAAQPSPAPARGLFGLVRRPGTGPRTASLGDAPGTGRDAARPAAAPRSTSNAIDVPLGTVLPYGEIARVCDARRRDMGKRVEDAPGRGNPFALHDSAPGSDGPRTWYITGFADGCPRQFTAALALFGAPRMHEQLRYGLPAEEYPYSDTDKAYERIKSRICGVSRRKPCGAHIDSVERNTVFISTYERFGNNARWADVLLHDGAVLAKVIKSP